MSDSYAMGAPIIGSRMRKLLPQIYATTGKTLPSGALSEAIQGEAMANMDNFYKWAMLNRQKDQFDQQMALQQRHQKMLEDQVPGPWGKLVETGTQLATPYIYGKVMNDKPIFSEAIKGPVRNTWNQFAPESMQIAGPGQAPNVSVAGQAPLQFQARPELGAIDSTLNPSMMDAVGSKLNTSVMQPVGNAIGMGAQPVLTNAVSNAVSPYAATAASALGHQAISPASQMLGSAIQNSAIGQTAPQFAVNAGLAEGAGAAAEGAVSAAGGAAVEGGAAASSTQAAGSGVSGMYGLGAGLAGMAVTFALSSFGLDKTVAGALGGATSGLLIGMKMGSIGGPIGALVGGVIGALASMISSWICGAVDKHVGMTDHEKLAMEKLKDYCKENERGWLRWYIENGEELVACIEAEEDNLVQYYSQIRIAMIEPVVALVDHGDMEGAFILYKTMALFQFYRYAPHIPVPEDINMRRRQSYAEATA